MPIVSGVDNDMAQHAVNAVRFLGKFFFLKVMLSAFQLIKLNFCLGADLTRDVRNKKTKKTGLYQLVLIKAIATNSGTTSRMGT